MLSAVATRKRAVARYDAVSVVAQPLMTGAGYWVAHGALGGITISQAPNPEDPPFSEAAT